jgi:hypothetical protein
VVVLLFYHNNCTNLGAQKRGRKSKSNPSANFEDVISAGEIRVAKTGGRKRQTATFFVLRIVFLEEATPELLANTEVRSSHPTLFLLMIPISQCLEGWPQRQKIGVLGVYYDDSTRSVTSCVTLPYGSIKEKVQISSKVGVSVFVSF